MSLRARCLAPEASEFETSLFLAEADDLSFSPSFPLALIFVPPEAFPILKLFLILHLSPEL